MPFIYPHRQTIAEMYASLYPNSDPNTVTDLQLLQMRKQMIEASRIYPFKDKFEENFQRVFGFGAPDDEQAFWQPFYAMKDEYDLERFLRLVVPHAVMDATVILEFMNKNMIRELDVLHDLIAFQQRLLVGSAHSPHSRHSSSPTSINAVTQALQQAALHLPMAGYTSLLSKHQSEKVAELRKQYVSDVSFLKAVNQHFKERQRKRGQGKYSTNPLDSLKGIDPLLLIDAVLTDPNSNDIAVECSLFLKTIVASINHNNKKNQVTIVLPSPQFIYQWCKHPMLSSTTVTFVVANSTVCSIMSLSKYIKGKPITIHEYGDTQRSNWRSQKIPPAHLFAVNHPGLAASPFSINQVISTFTSKKLLNPHCTVVGFFGRKKSEVSKLSKHLPSNNILKALSLQSISYLPRKIALSTSPRLKIIFQALYNPYTIVGSSSVELAKYSRIALRKTSFLFFENKSFLTVSTDFDSIGKPYHLLLRSMRGLTGTSLMRTPPKSFTGLGPHIKVWYTTQKLKTGKIRYNVYICPPVGTMNREQSSLNRDNAIDFTKRQLIYNPKISETEFFFQYLLGPARTKEKRTSIRALVADAFRSTKQVLPLALREFWYIHPGLEEQLEPSFVRAIERFMLSKYTTSAINGLIAEDLEASVEEFFESRSLSFKAAFIEYLADLFALAETENYVDQNVFEETDENGNKYRRNIPNEIRNALRERVLTAKQSMEFVSLVLKNRHDVRYLGACIQYFTGMDARELCALRWRSFYYNNEMRHHGLVVDEQLSMDGNSMKQLRLPREESLPDGLGSILQTIRCELLQSLSPTVVDDMHILMDKADNSVLSPKVYRDFIRELLSQFFTVDLQVLIPHATDNEKLINLMGDNIDLLRHNFTHYAKNHGMYTNGESSYVLGITPKYTMDINYIDHDNPLSRHMVHTKSMRVLGHISRTSLNNAPAVQMLSGGRSNAKRMIINVPIAANDHYRYNIKNEHAANVQAVLNKKTMRNKEEDQK